MSEYMCIYESLSVFIGPSDCGNQEFEFEQSVFRLKCMKYMSSIAQLNYAGRLCGHWVSDQKPLALEFKPLSRQEFVLR